mgnify:CR=1 FL=1
MKIGKIIRNPYPVSLIVDIHDFCNARCKMCPYGKLHKRLIQGKMEWDLYTKIIDDFSQLTKKYNFRGVMTYCNMGEPFLEERLFMYTNYAEERGIYVYINTNASVMYPHKIDFLIKSGFKGNFNISFHAATKDLYEDLMGINQNESINNIKYLLTKYPKEKITINALNYNWPEDEERKIKAFLSIFYQGI